MDKGEDIAGEPDKIRRFFSVFVNNKTSLPASSVPKLKKWYLGWLAGVTYYLSLKRDHRCGGPAGLASMR